eukprot:jgi/Psemu1/358/gm1.358_g
MRYQPGARVGILVDPVKRLNRKQLEVGRTTSNQPHLAQEERQFDCFATQLCCKKETEPVAVAVAVAAMSSNSITSSPSMVSASASSAFSASTATGTYDDSITKNNHKDQPQPWPKWFFAEKLSAAFCEGVESRFSCVDEDDVRANHGIIAETLDPNGSDGESDGGSMGISDYRSKQKRGIVSGFRMAHRLNADKKVAHHGDHGDNHTSNSKTSNNFIAEYHKSRTGGYTNTNPHESEVNGSVTNPDIPGNHRGWGGSTATPQAAKSPVDHIYLTDEATETFDTFDTKRSSSTGESANAPIFESAVQRAIRGLSLTTKPKPKQTLKSQGSDSEYSTEDDDEGTDTNHDTEDDTDSHEKELHTLYDTARYYEDDSTYTTDKTASSSGETFGQTVSQQPSRGRYPSDSRNDSLHQLSMHTNTSNESSNAKGRDHPSVGKSSQQINSRNRSNNSSKTKPNTHPDVYSLPSSLVVPSPQLQKQEKEQPQKQKRQQKHLPALHTFPPKIIPARNRSYGSHQSAGSTSLSSFGASSRCSSSSTATNKNDNTNHSNNNNNKNDNIIHYRYHAVSEASDSVPRTITKVKQQKSRLHAPLPVKPKPHPTEKHKPASMRIAQQLQPRTAPKLPATQAAAAASRVASATPIEMDRNRSEASSIEKKIALGRKRAEGASMPSSASVSSVSAGSTKSRDSNNTNGSATIHVRTSSPKTFAYVVNHSLFHSNQENRKRMIHKKRMSSKQ